ncbi:histidine phosphatase family protein [Paenibacillus sp. P3E]|nr:histidine phosphatase family protein [Paenibacillus sp. P3E]
MIVKKLVYAYMITLLLMVSVSAPMIEAAGYTVGAKPVDPALLASLRQGGYILFVRHGEATTGQDQPNLDLRDCTTQRNLSNEARRQAVLLGKAIRRLHIPVQTPIVASPFCRTRETAALAFGADNVQTDPFWVNIYNLSGNVTSDEQESTLTALRSVLEKTPAEGTNQVIIAHSFPRGLGLGEIPYLGTVVLKPKGEGHGYDIVSRISLSEWLSTQ